MNKNTSKTIFDFNQWLGWNFKREQFLQSKLTTYIFETMADLSNIFIQQLI